MDYKKVTVLTPHGRRQNIQITPSTTILQILEDVCKKYKEFDSDEYGLKHHNTILDLSLMFRFSGLPNNCLLEMVEIKKKREDVQVTLCIQLENGSRLQDTFDPSENLLNILKKLYPDKVGENQQPVIIYMRKEIYGEELSKTTLKSLGITSGRSMVRLINKSPEDLKKQANVYVPIKIQPKPEEDRTQKHKPTVATTNQGLQITTETIKSLKKEEKVESKSEIEDKKEEVAPNPTPSPGSSTKPAYEWGTGGRAINEKIQKAEIDQTDEDTEMEEEPEICELGERNAVIFSLATAQKVVDDLPDSFFDLTVDDIKLILRDLKKVSEGNEDAPLLTAKLREIEKNNTMLHKLTQYKKGVIRIQFPNRLVLQGTFKPVEKVEIVYDFVRGYLNDPNLDFHLFTTPPKNILPTDKTLLEVDCIPTAVLHFGVDNNIEDENFLKPELLTKLTSADGAILAASKTRFMGTARGRRAQSTEEATTSEPPKSTGAIPKQRRTDASFKESSANSGPSGNVPKWFKPIKK